jgi:hypothetical protein
MLIHILKIDLKGETPQKIKRIAKLTAIVQLSESVAFVKDITVAFMSLRNQQT